MKRFFYVLIMAICGLLLLACKTKVPPASQETILNIKDSIVYTIRDSVRITEKYKYRDSVLFKDSIVTVVDDSGNVLRTEYYRLKESYKNKEESLNTLQDKYDKLLQESSKQDSVTEQKPYIVEAQLSKWDKFKLSIGGYLISAIIGLVAFFLIKRFWLKK